MAITGLAIYHAARRYLEVSFRHLGRDETGLDCIGLGIVACREAGLLPESFDVRNYSRTPNGNHFIRELIRAGLCRAPKDIARRPGIIVTMRYGREPMHLAIIGEHGRLIHAHSSVGHVAEHALTKTWEGRITSAWHFPEVRY